MKITWGVGTVAGLWREMTIPANPWALRAPGGAAG